MKYDLDEIRQKPGTGSIKWDMYDDPTIIGMNTAAMDFPPAQCITDALRAIVDRNCFDYHYKPANFNRVICDWWKRKYNWNVEENWINVGPGMWTAMNLTMLAFTKPGDRVIVQSPYFYPITNIIKARGLHTVYNPMKIVNGRYEYDLDDFEKKVAEERPRVYVMVNPHNPTGRVLTREELQRIVDICVKYNVIIVSDEVHQNFTFDGIKHIPVASLSKEAEAITATLCAGSKAYNIMDLTFSYVVIANPELRRLYEQEITSFSYDFATNAFGVAALMAAYSEGAEEWETQVHEYLTDNLNYFEDYMKKNVPELPFYRPEAGFMAWVDCRSLGLNAAQLHDFFLKEVKVSPSWGESFGPLGEGFERINFGTQRSRLEEACRRIEAAVKNHK